MKKTDKKPQKNEKVLTIYIGYGIITNGVGFCCVKST